MFRDAADRPEASYRPDLADEIDRPEDRLLELIASQAVKLPPGIQRTWLNQIVSQLAIGAMREAAKDGSLSDLFDGIEPNKADLELVARLLAELIDADNPRLQAKCLAFVFGLTGKSETEIGDEEGVGKAAVSKRCIRLKQAFGLRPSRGMKSDKACDSYRRRQMGKRARPSREPWAFAGLLETIYEN
jgi:hypothetical protein